MFFNNSQYTRLGNRLKCNPAVKTEDDRKALIRAVETGIISLIATDHAPHTVEEKSQPYFKAPSGIPLIQFSLLAVLELVHRGATIRQSDSILPTGGLSGKAALPILSS